MSKLSSATSIVVESKSKNRSLIIFEPLSKGFGHTLGNALRRVLVSSLTGCAVVEAKIDGALHEYATLEGVQEDVLTILLNLKEGAFALTGNRDEVVLALKTNQVGPITLDMIELPHDLEIANPDHIIANLNQPVDFHMTFKVMRGHGELLAGYKEPSATIEHNAEEPVVQDVNTLSLNAIFNPIKRVSYQVESVRVGERTDLDKLIIDLETNGTITPEVALQEARSIFLTEGLDAILSLKPIELDHSLENNEIDPVLATPIDQLALSARSTKCLKTEGIYFIGDLITKTKDKLLLTPNLGKRSLKEIEMALENKSLTLGTELPDWPPAELSYPSKDDEEEIMEK